MNEKEVLTEIEERGRRQSSLLSAFEEIAQTFLDSVRGDRGNGKVFSSLQDYLDASVLVDGVYCRRRTVLLEIHDLKEDLEAPSALKSKTLAKLELLRIRPLPQVAFYQDIATAILRMEVVIRLEAMQALAEAIPEAERVMPRRRGWTASRPMTNLRAMGYGLAAAACSAAVITLLNKGYVAEVPVIAPAQLAANQIETPSDITRRTRDCRFAANDAVGMPINGDACTPGVLATYNQRKLFVTGNSFKAAELVMYSALTESGFGSGGATHSRGASPAREIPDHSSWATTVEANNIARPALPSEVQTQ